MVGEMSFNSEHSMFPTVFIMCFDSSLNGVYGLLCNSAINASLFGRCMTACTSLPINYFQLFSAALNFGT